VPVALEPDCEPASVPVCEPDWAWPPLLVSCCAAAGSVASGDTLSDNAATSMVRWLLFMINLQDFRARMPPRFLSVARVPDCRKRPKVTG
jgi:hypothetical protein